MARILSSELEAFVSVAVSAPLNAGVQMRENTVQEEKSLPSPMVAANGRQRPTSSAARRRSSAEKLLDLENPVSVSWEPKSNRTAKKSVRYDNWV